MRVGLYVSHGEECRALLGECDERVEDHDGGGGVERSRRFVDKKHLRSIGECTRKGDSELFAAGEGSRLARSKGRFEAYTRKQVVNVRVGQRHFTKSWAYANVIGDRPFEHAGSLRHVGDATTVSFEANVTSAASFEKQLPRRKRG